MREVLPTVHLIARPVVDLGAMEDYLKSVGGEEWLHQRLAGTAEPLNDVELLVEFAARACYRSWKPGLNPNVRKIRTESRSYFLNLLSSGHGSVFEHANYTFVVRNVSRVATHEIVRHRAGAAYSQESLRYVRLVDIGFRVPHALEPLRRECVELVERLEGFQVEAARALGLDDEGLPFHIKKEVTSALRRLAPMGTATDIVMTMNLRTLRHVVTMRTAPGAEEEMRFIFSLIAELMMTEAPLVFQDFRRSDDGSWTPEFHKV